LYDFLPGKDLLHYPGFINSVFIFVLPLVFYVLGAFLGVSYARKRAMISSEKFNKISLKAAIWIFFLNLLLQFGTIFFALLFSSNVFWGGLFRIAPIALGYAFLSAIVTYGATLYFLKKSVTKKG